MGRRELLFIEYRVSVWDDEKKVLDLDCGDGCTTRECISCYRTIFYSIGILPR